MEAKLKKFAEIMDADEVCKVFVNWLKLLKFKPLKFKVLLFEKATFLVIAQAQMNPHSEIHRFEKVSNIIKQFKLSCRSNAKANETNAKLPNANIIIMENN